MNDIDDALNKGLISFGKCKPVLRLFYIFGTMKDMAKLNPIELEIYWSDYFDLHSDRCGFIYGEAEL